MRRLFVGVLLLYTLVLIVRDARALERVVLREHGDDLDLCEAYTGHNALFRAECEVLYARVAGTSVLYQLPRAAWYRATTHWSATATLILALWPGIRWTGRRVRLWWHTACDLVKRGQSTRK
jgi:hypothetical protein